MGKNHLYLRDGVHLSHERVHTLSDFVERGVGAMQASVGEAAGGGSLEG